MLNQIARQIDVTVSTLPSNVCCHCWRWLVFSKPEDCLLCCELECETTFSDCGVTTCSQAICLFGVWQFILLNLLIGSSNIKAILLLRILLALLIEQNICVFLCTHTWRVCVLYFIDSVHHHVHHHAGNVLRLKLYVDRLAFVAKLQLIDSQTIIRVVYGCLLVALMSTTIMCTKHGHSSSLKSNFSLQATRF